MGSAFVPLTVFTKPWKEKSISELGEFIKGLGFDGIELPVRPGFQVEPENIQKDLPRAAKELAKFGLKIHSIAAPPCATGAADERTVAACAEAGVPIIRTMVSIDRAKGYMATVDAVRKDYASLVPALDKHGVCIGVQNHCDFFVGSAIGLVHAFEVFDPKHVAFVLDVAHCGLDGEPEEMAIDIAWSRMVMVNLKNAIRRIRPGSAESGEVVWEKYWTLGREGFASWKKTAEILRKREYKGPVCLTAEYSDEPAVDRLIAEDIAYAKKLFVSA